METIWLILTISIIIIGAFFAMWTVIKSADIFFRESDKIENMIRNNHPKEDVVNSLYSLHKKSFHRETGHRVRELAMMAETKYNIKLTK